MKKIILTIFLMTSFSFGQFLYPEIKKVVSDSATVLRSGMSGIAGDTATVLRTFVGASVDSVKFWDVIWSANSQPADSTGDLDAILWNATVKRKRFTDGDQDTIFSMPFYKTSDMDSVDIVFYYKSQNASLGWSADFYAHTTLVEQAYAASTGGATGRLKASISGLSNNTLYNILFRAMADDPATYHYIWFVSVSVLRSQ